MLPRRFRSLAIYTLSVGLSFVFMQSSQASAQTDNTNDKTKTETGQPVLSKENTAILETCFKCHGAGGVSQIPTHPTIAGQKAGYLVKQLNEFRRSQEILSEQAATQSANQEDEKQAVSGRSDFIMNHMVSGLSKNNFTSLAVYISLLPCDGNANPDNNDIDQGEKIPKAPNVVARCVSCHGENGISSQPNVPNLAGQRRAYLRRELLMMRETAWGGNNLNKNEWRGHPIMEQQSARLRIEDVDSISNYFSQLNCRSK